MPTTVTNLSSNTDWGTIITNTGNNNTAYTITTNSGRDFRVNDFTSNVQVEYVWTFPEQVYVTGIDISFDGTSSSISNNIILYYNQTQKSSLPTYLTSIKIRQTVSYATPNMPFIVKGLSITYDTEPTPLQPSNSIKYNLINPNNGNSHKLIIGNKPISFTGSNDVNLYLGTFKDENNRPIPYYQVSSTYDSSFGLYDILTAQCEYPYTTPVYLSTYSYSLDAITCNCFDNLICTIYRTAATTYEGSIRSSIGAARHNIFGSINVKNVVGSNDKLLVLGSRTMYVYDSSYTESYHTQIPIYGDYCTFCGKFLCVTPDYSELLSSIDGVNWTSELILTPSADGLFFGFIDNQIIGEKTVDGQKYLYNFSEDTPILPLSNTIVKFKETDGVKYFWTNHDNKLYAYLNNDWVLCCENKSYDVYDTITKINDKYYMFDYSSKKLLVSDDFKNWNFIKYSLRSLNNNG